MNDVKNWRMLSRFGLLLPLIIFVAVSHGDLFTLYQVQSQDLPVLIALMPIGLVLAYWIPSWSLPERLPSPIVLLAIGSALVLLLGWGSYALMGNFPLSRDEHMVVFDMAVFNEGRLAAPLAAQWRDYSEALVPAFLLKAVAPSALVSDYLPVNALLRLLFSKIADPAFFNPCLVVLGGAALWDIARREFGDDRRSRWVALVIYLSSAQMLVSAMTTYAMTAHMALNLVWLAAFLRGGRMGYAVAIVTGFLAVGLHQVVFHPLFAAPFILWKLRDGNWRPLVVFGLAYAAILVWWMSYPQIVLMGTGIVAADAQPGSGFIDKALPLLLHRDPGTVPMMILNLMRFVAWQNLALLPLLAAAVPLIWRDRGIGGPLICGILATLLFVTLILPYQGHGWGYRYLHPLLGSFALLAGLGYQRLAKQFGQRADGLVLVLSALTVVGSIPFLLFRTYGFVAPHVALERSIAREKADFVLIDTDVSPSTDGRWAANAIDHARNDPYLRNRPLRFSSRQMDAGAVMELCRRGQIRLVTRADMHRAGFALNVPLASPRFEAMAARISGEPCLVGGGAST